MTILRAQGLSEQTSDLRRFGLPEEGIMAQQCLLSVVQTAQGLPISHRVWGGSVAETSTLASAIAEVTHNYPVQRIAVVADRGLPSVETLGLLDGLKFGDQPLEYSVVVPGRRYAEFVDVLAEVQPLCVSASAELIGEMPWTPVKAKDSPQKCLVWVTRPAALTSCPATYVTLVSNSGGSVSRCSPSMRTTIPCTTSPTVHPRTFAAAIQRASPPKGRIQALK